MPATRSSALYRRVLRNAGLLVCGDFVANAAGLVSVSLTVHALGAASFGILVLIQAYAELIGELFGLQSWQAITRKGEQALAAGQRQKLAKILRFGLRLDLAASTAGAAVAASTAWLYASWRGWPPGITWIACLYGLAILFRLSSTPISVFNLFGRYGTFSRHAASTGLLRLAVVGLVAAVHPTLEAFALAGLASTLVAQLLQMALAWRILLAEGVPLSLRWIVHPSPTGLDRSFRRSFLLSTAQSSLSGTLMLVSTHLVTLLVGVSLGTVAAAQYRVIQMIGNVLTRLTRPLVHSTYPEFVAASRRCDFATVRQLVRSIDRVVVGLAAVAAVAFLLVGSAAIRICFGVEFDPVYWPMLTFLILSFWGVSNRTVIPRLWAIDGHRAALAMQLVAATAHLTSLALFGRAFGIPGVVASFSVFHCVFRLLGTALLRRREGSWMRAAAAPTETPEPAADLVGAASHTSAAA